MSLAEQIAALESALAKGVRSVSYDGNTVVYQSAADMRATLANLKRQAGAAPAPFYPEHTRDGL
jgi:hypothetical protein